MSTSIVDRQGSLRYLFISLLFISCSTPTSAVLAEPNWQSPYVGAYVGGAYGSNHASTNVGSVTSTSYFLNSANVNAVNNAGTSTNNPAAIIAGIQAGHDWIWKKLIYGVALDYGTVALNSSNRVTNATYPDNSGNYSVTTSMTTNWLFTLRGRLGYQAMVRWPSLLYVTGGVAVTQLRVNNNFSDNTSTAGAGGTDTSQNQIGWTLGAGVDLASFSHATLDLEYLYVNVPSVKTTSSIYNSAGGFGIPVQSLNSPFSTTGKFHANLLKIALNYRFDE